MDKRSIDKLESFLSLADNWDGYGSGTISPAAVEAAQEFVRRNQGHPIGNPHATPCSSGNVQLEWHKGDKSLELEFEADGTIHYLLYLNSEEDDEEDFGIILDEGAKLMDDFVALTR